jgi:hypothetical protein
LHYLIGHRTRSSFAMTRTAQVIHCTIYINLPQLGTNDKS